MKNSTYRSPDGDKVEDVAPASRVEQHHAIQRVHSAHTSQGGGGQDGGVKLAATCVQPHKPV